MKFLFDQEATEAGHPNLSKPKVFKHHGRWTQQCVKTNSTPFLFTSSHRWVKMDVNIPLKMV